jgi:hypothetical protein
MTSTALATIAEKVPDLALLRKIQKSDNEQQRFVSGMDLAGKVLTHPVYALVLAFAIIETLEAQGLMGNIAATSLEVGLLTTGLLNTLTDSGALQTLIPLFTKT